MPGCRIRACTLDARGYPEHAYAIHAAATSDRPLRDAPGHGSPGRTCQLVLAGPRQAVARGSRCGQSGRRLAATALSGPAHAPRSDRVVSAVALRAPDARAPRLSSSARGTPPTCTSARRHGEDRGWQEGWCRPRVRAYYRMPGVHRCMTGVRCCRITDVRVACCASSADAVGAWGPTCEYVAPDHVRGDRTCARTAVLRNCGSASARRREARRRAHEHSCRQPAASIAQACRCVRTRMLHQRPHAGSR